jgi:hypothetical protein
VTIFTDSNTVTVKLKIASPPVNNAFASAIALSTTLPGTRSNDWNQDATFETGEENSFGGSALGDQSVWYTFTPTSTGRYKFKLDPVTMLGGIRYFGISIYTGSAVNALTRIGRNICGGTGSHQQRAAVELQLTSGVTYRIKVWSPIFSGEINPRTIRFDFTWSVGYSQGASTPANDNLANAINLGNNAPFGIQSGTTKGATVEAAEGTFNDDSVWYKFTATANGTQDFHLTRTGSNPDWYPYLEVNEALVVPPADYNDLNFVDESSPSAIPNGLSTVDLNSFAFTSGKTYYMRVINGEGATGATDDFSLQVGSAPPAPTNDVRTALNSAPLLNVYPSYLDATEWKTTAASSWFTNRYAGHADGTTVSATATGGDPTVAGFAATRNVWYVLGISKTGSYKVWVESSVDCVLAIYNKSGTGIGSMVAEDDDSGAGNWPEVTATLSVGDYWVIVDSKTEGTFRLKYELATGGSPPANNLFANATVISSLPTSVAGTTVGASAEADEHDGEWFGFGPKDSVWYKYVATFSGQIKITASGVSNNVDGYINIDGWQGTTLTGLVRNPAPPLPYQNTGSFWWDDTPVDRENQALVMNVVSGQTYYLRVQTESGGSEAFTLNVEAEIIYLDLQPSGAEVGPFTDTATATIILSVSGVEDFHQVLATDAATAYLDLVPSAVEFKAFQYVDSGTVRVLVSPGVATDCYFHLEPSWTADGVRKWGWQASTRRWSVDGARRWTWTEGEGLPQVC